MSDSFMEYAARRMDDEQFAALFSPEGLAPTCEWQTEDNWIVSYTTKRIRAGRLDGLFAVMLYQPRPAKKPERWERVKLERCDTRREAKQRALAYYYDHSPKMAKRHGWDGAGLA